MTTKHRSPFAVESMLLEHRKECAEIESLCYEQPYSEREINNLLMRKSTVGFICVDVDGIVLGFSIYSFGGEEYEIDTLGVHPDSRRLGVGTALMNDMFSRVRKARKRKPIIHHIRPDNLQGQLFAKSVGFYCSSIQPEGFEESPSYLFERTLSYERQ